MIDRVSSAKFAAMGRRMNDAEYAQAWLARVRERSVVTETGCIVWQGFCTHKGYGLTTYRGDNVAIHRKAYALATGKTLPIEVFVCHTCDVRACWNVEHLFEGDAAANNRDCGNKGRHHNSVKTHCKRGHEYTPENTFLRVTPTTTMRWCLTCAALRVQSKEYKDKARERRQRYKAIKNGAAL